MRFFKENYLYSADVLSGMHIPFSFDGYRLRPAESADLPYALMCAKESILNSVSDEEREYGDAWIGCTLSMTSAYMERNMNPYDIFILEDLNGRRSGMLWVERSSDQFTCDLTGYILGIYVEPELRGIGLGKALIKAAEDWCRDRGLLSISLNVGRYNKSAKQLYEESGFQERSTVMRKDLR